MNKKILAAIFVLIFCAGFSVTLGAENAIESSTELALQATTVPEARLEITQRYQFPFLQGTSPLTENNNISLALIADITPISISGRVNVVWTPIAFLEFTLGGRIGSGWSIGDLNGIGLSKPNPYADPDNFRPRSDGSAFDGAHWGARAGGAFQFNFAALFPGEWNNVIVRTFHEINYAGYTRAGPREFWFFENDGAHVNGFNYRGNYLLGYQMPIFLNMVGLLAESTMFVFDASGRGINDRPRWSFSCVMSFTVFENFSITLLAQFRTQRDLMEEGGNLVLDTRDPRQLRFHRVAAVLAYRF